MPSIELIPELYREEAQKMAENLDQLDQVLVAAHINLDGDALGSLWAAAIILQRLGKTVALYSSTAQPRHLQFVKLPSKIYNDLAAINPFPKSALFLDCGEQHRLGLELELSAANFPSLNLDHHQGSGMGSLASWVEPKAASTTQLLAYLALAKGLDLSGDLGQAIALGLVTDTGGFAHTNTTADVFALSAYLAGLGVDFPRLREELDHHIRFEQMLLWGGLTKKVRLEAGGALAICTVSLADFQTYGAMRDDLEGFVEYLRRLQGVKLAALLREDTPQVSKFSLRSVRELDVHALAKNLGGGGHKNASGGTINQPLEQARATLLQVLLAGLTESNL